jgi:hypothetical protein
MLNKIYKGAFEQSWNLFQIRSFKGQKGHILNSIKKVLHVFEILNARVGWSFWRVNCKDLIVHHLEDSTGIDFVEYVAENETIAESETELFLGRLFGE